MKKTMFSFYALCAFLLLTFSSFANADRNSDIETMFDWAEKKYPQYFSPAPAVTQTIADFEGHSWRYRYYPNTNTYMGVNNADNVFAFGVEGTGLVRVGSMSEVLSLANNDNNVSAGNGNCVNVPLVTNGRKTIMQVTNVSPSATLNIETIYDEVTETQAKTSTTASSPAALGVNTTSNTVQHYSIKDNYFEISRIDTTADNSALGSSVAEITFTPAKRVPALVVCENQTWTSTYTINTKTTVAGFSNETVSSISTNGIVEAVNESKTTPVATFNTVRVSENSGDLKTITWTSIPHGIAVYQETYDSAGTLLSTAELTTLE